MTQIHSYDRNGSRLGGVAAILIGALKRMYRIAYMRLYEAPL